MLESQYALGTLDLGFYIEERLSIVVGLLVFLLVRYISGSRFEMVLKAMTERSA